jgi:predicted nucleic acid-binding Zn ribbon protein
VERGNQIERRRESMSGTTFIMMVIMILILLFVLMNIGPLVAF